MLDKVKTHFSDAVKSRFEYGFTKASFCFGISNRYGPNFSINKYDCQEVYNTKCLSCIFGIKSIQAPVNCKEIVDVILLQKIDCLLKALMKEKDKGHFVYEKQ